MLSAAWPYLLTVVLAFAGIGALTKREDNQA